MSLLSHLSEWPCRRTTARSGAVAATTGGMESRWPCGMSTHTYGSWWAARKPRVSSWLPGVIQVRLRNSTHTRCGPGRAGHDVVLAGLGDGEPRRELQQDRAQLALGPQWVQRGQEPLPHL